jgi:GNAT superfamily N-acetyltransferase
LIDFHRYYLEFLEASDQKLEAGQRVFPSELRSKPDSELSFKIHDLIVAEYQDTLIHSINPSLEHRYRPVAPSEPSEELLAQVDDAFFSISPYGHYWISEWYRYSISQGFDDDPDVVVLNHSHRELIEESRKTRRGKLYGNWLWEKAYFPMLSEGRVFAVVKDGKILSRSSAGDIPIGAANIDIWTHEDYRRQGYGSKCVRQVVNWCIKNDRVLVYLVSASNTVSIRLAEELGFTRFAREIRTSAIVS